MSAAAAANGNHEGNGMGRLEKELADERAKVAPAAARACAGADRTTEAGEGSVVAANKVIQSARRADSKKFRLPPRKK